MYIVWKYTRLPESYRALARLYPLLFVGNARQGERVATYQEDSKVQIVCVYGRLVNLGCR